MRIIKKPEIRKQEIMDKAQLLFYKFGYENTSVNLIISELGISKGGFYHYFNSKMQLLDAISERFVKHTLKSIIPIVENPELNALQKLNLWFSTVSSIKTNQINLMQVFANVIYSDKNLISKANLKKKWIELISPIFSKVIMQGCQERLFNPKFPKETGEILIRIGMTLHESLAGKFERLMKTRDPASLLRLIKIYENIYERILGLKQGSLQFVNQDFINKLIGKS